MDSLPFARSGALLPTRIATWRAGMLTALLALAINAVHAVPPAAPPAATPPAAAPPPPAAPAPETTPPPAAVPYVPAVPFEAQQLIGRWRTEEPDVEKPFLLLDFSRGDDGAWTILASLPPAMIFDRPLNDATVGDDGRFSGSVTVAGATIQFTGAVDQPTRRIALRLSASRGALEEAEEVTLEPTRAMSTGAAVLRYTGELEAMGMTLPMAIMVEDAGEFGWLGAVDIPSQGVRRMPLIVQADLGTFTITIPAGVPAIMQLAPRNDGAELAGSFKQGPINAPIVFTRTNAPIKGSARPQEPLPPFPYTVRDVRIPTPLGHELAGTLTLPADASTANRVPGVVMLSGSGLQDRDESLLGHKPFLVIADALTRAGIAVLRCDDRGVGESSGNGATATTSDFADDGRAAMAFLRAQPEIDPARCGYAGHSEGGISGPLAALGDQEAGTPVAFVVMLAGPAVTGAEILPLQMRRILLASGQPAELIDPVVAAQSKVLDAVVAGAPRETLAQLLSELIAAQQNAAALQNGIAPPPPPALDAPEVAMAIAQVDSPWMRAFLTLDPAPALKAVKAPILAMNGDRDTQVDTDQNLLRIESIRREAGLPVTVKRYESLNHLFQPATTGAVEEYSTIETTFDPTALADLVAWIQATTAPATSKPAQP